MRVGLVDVDSRIPNLALMKLSAWHKAQGDTVEIAAPLWGDYDRVYASKVFTFTDDDSKPWGCEVVRGGTGYDLTTRLTDEQESITPDYALFDCDHAIGFTTRGCIRKCQFCVVPAKEGRIRVVQDLRSMVLPGQRWAMLLDNNLTALPSHLEVIMRQSCEMNVAVDITQAMDARLVDDEVAALIAHGKHKASIRFSADDPNNDASVNRGLDAVHKAGIPKSRIMVFVLVGAPWLDLDESANRIQDLRNRGFRPFAMPYKSVDGTFDASSIPFVKQLARWTNRQELVACTWDEYRKGLPRAATLQTAEWS